MRERGHLKTRMIPMLEWIKGDNGQGHKEGEVREMKWETARGKPDIYIEIVVYT